MNRNHSKVAAMLPSLTDVAFLLPLILLFVRLKGLPTLLQDGDTGWHIRTGDWILANGRVPQTDMFSFTMPGQPWYAWEWLWDVLAAMLHARFGMPGVVVASTLLICLTFALLFRLVLRHCENRFIAIAVLFLAVAASSIHWLARPHLFTMLFVVVFLSLLDRVNEGRTKLLWLLPVLMVVWVNLHGGFVAGLLILFAFAAGELVSWVVAPKGESNGALRRAGQYGAALLGCAAATLVNPYTYRLHAHIARYLSEPYHREYVNEFKSISFQSPAAYYFEPLMLLGVLAAFAALRDRRFAQGFLLLGWLHLGLLMARNVPLAALIAAPAVAAMVAGWVEALANSPGGAQLASWVSRLAGGFRGVAEEFGRVDRLPRLHLPSLAGAALVMLLAFAPQRLPSMTAEYSAKDYPVKAIRELGCNFNESRVFTFDDWGDYMIYALYPEGKVFVDGRTDFYGAEFGKKYIDLINAQNWESILGKHGVDAVMLPVRAALTSTMKESRRWTAVYEDSVAIVFRPSDRAAWRSAQQNPIAQSDGGTVCGHAATNALGRGRMTAEETNHRQVARFTEKH